MAEFANMQLLTRIMDIQNELITADPDLDTLMDLVARRSQELTAADGAAVELAEGEDMVYRAVSGIAGGQLGLRIPRMNSLSGQCVEKREIQFCEDSETCQGVNKEACRTVGLRSFVVQPLLRGTDIIGVVKVLWSQPKGYGPEVPGILDLLSRTIAGVLYNALRWDDLKNHSENLAHLASHDTLTGVKNRSAFYDALRQHMAHIRRSGGRLGVALFDLDGLKAVNDTLGHQAGDVYIRTFAQRLAQRVRETDTLARLGGDEFAVLFPIQEELENPLILGRAWADAAGGPVGLDQGEVPMSASAGVAVYCDDALDIESLLAKADERMYADKKNRRKGRGS